jgi:RNA polymerase sigma-70 factor (ECF subfamily)
VTHDTSIELLRRCREGDHDAPADVYRRYVERLLNLARSRISARLSRRVDADDIVQSAFRSFFRRTRDGAFHLERSGDLWRLLATITLHKVLGQVEFHRADRRDMHRELAPGQTLLERLGREPSPDELSVAFETLEAIMAPLLPEQRAALELRLQGHTYEEIAQRTGRTERTVRRWLADVKQDLERRVNTAGDDLHGST